MRATRRADAIWLGLVIALALALRLALWGQPLHEPANDEVEYLAVAQDLYEGRGWVFYDSYRWLRAPLYPLFLAGSLALADGDLRLAALPGLLLSVANVALAYALARRIAPRGALLAALITALLWTNATFASLYMAETLFSALLMLALLALLAAADRMRAPGRGGAALAVAAGACFGLAALTRSAVLPFIPLAALWLAAAARQRPLRWGRPVMAAALTLLAAAATIAPWTLRNAAAYGRPILIETGLSYNLWAFNEPREDLDTIHRTLEAIPNPAARSDYATARGLERLREDPAILARKIWPNWVFLARVKPIQDRFLLESYYDSVDLPLFAAALIFDDALYVLVALAAAAALVRGQDLPAAPRRLALAYLVALVGSMLLTHGEARYRHFLFPILIPYAAAALHDLGRRPFAPMAQGGARARGAGRATQGGARGWLAGALCAMLAWTIATSYPRDWAAENIARGWYTLAGDLARAGGRADLAMERYRAAARAQRVPDPLLRLGDTARATGDAALALDAYGEARRLIPIYPPTAARIGDLRRELGDDAGARDAFAAPFIGQQQITDWAWRALRPAPRAAVDVGGGLDHGYVGGVFPAEDLLGARARWAGARAEVRLASRPGRAIVTLRLASARPDGRPARVQVCANGRCTPIEVAGGWRSYEIPVAAAPGQTVVELRAETFRAPDGRRLSVMLDAAALSQP